MPRWTYALIVATLAASASPARAVSGGQIDDFEDTTTQAWSPLITTTSNIATGGPAGSNDNYLQIDSSGGFGSGGRLVSFNATQWTGSFTSIAAIAMDLKNTSAAAKPMRLALRTVNGPSSTPGYVSTTAFNLPNDGLWHNAVFSLDGSALTAINGPPDLATFLASVGEMRVLSAVSPSTMGDMVTGPVGVDNITAQVPEPSALGLLAAALTFARRRRV